MKTRWTFILTLILGLAAPLVRAAETAPDPEVLSRIVIQSGGRKKPLETFALESLQTLYGRRTYKDPETGKRISALNLMTSFWLGGRDGKALPLILVENPTLRKHIGLDPQGKYYSFNTLRANETLMALRETVGTKNDKGQDLNAMEKLAETVLIRMQMLHNIVTGDAFTVVPIVGHDASGSWMTLTDLASGPAPEEASGVLAAFADLLKSYKGNDAAGFQKAGTALGTALSQLGGKTYPTTKSIDREMTYNRLHPFRWAWVLYGISFFVLLSARGFLPGMALFTAGVAFHIYGFTLRCLIAQRPPVTNMYESVIWVALGVTVIALGLGVLYKSRLYGLCAAPLAVLGLILSDLLPVVLNPSINPLPPVLRDNFWLVTHVLTITLSYGAFALAMGIGHYILGLYLWKPASIDSRSPVYHLLYRVIQIGVFLLTAGTILGGVWAYYSWGRFWGWDPKETWALIALLMYIAATHGRMAGWWDNFGLAVAAVICFNGVLMAWYGVNFVLGAGLHSYGFGGGGVQWVTTAVVADLLFVIICIAARSRKKEEPEPEEQAPAT